MDYDDSDGVTSCFSVIFRSFVCVALAVLLGIHIYAYFWGHPLTEPIEGDVSDIKYVVMQLTKGLTEVNKKHEHLQTEIERISQTLPAVAAAANRATDAIEPALKNNLKNIHHYDVISYDRQLVDYALESAGAQVINTGNTIDHVNYQSKLGYMLHTFSTFMCQQCLGARNMIQPNTLPGECWAFKGSRGEATVRLLGAIFVTGVSLEHIPSVIAPTKEITSAPRLFSLEGVGRKDDAYPHDFGTFEYDRNGKPIQYFEVKQAPKPYNIVRVRFLSNWGNPVYTCVYRLRIHGKLSQAGRAATDDIRVDNE